jgi:hypothetical protein
MPFVYVLISFSVAVPIAMTQHALFLQSDTSGPGLLFSYRMSDMSVYPWIPGMFMGLGVGIVIYYYTAKTFLGDRFQDFLFSGDRYGPYYKQFNLTGKIAFGLAIGMSVLNLLTFDTFLQIDEKKVLYSQWWSLETFAHQISDIEKVTIYSERKAPIGTINHNPYIGLVFKDGSRLDTFYLIEWKNHANDVLRALNVASNGRLVPEKKTIDESR